MIPKHRNHPHPGEILLEEFLVPMEITQTALAERLGVSMQLVNTLINGKRGITAETAWKLSQAFKTTPEFWMNMQVLHDLSLKRPTGTIKAFAR